MKRRYAWLALLAMTVPMSGFADEHEEAAPPALTDVWVFAPKADKADEFRAAMKEYMAWRTEQGDSRTWMAFTPVISEKMNRVMYRACCFDWADQDAYQKESEEKGFGPKFSEMVAPLVDHVHRHIDRIDFENSYWTEDEKGPYFGATTWYLDESHSPEAYGARVRMSEIAKDGWAGDDNQWLWISQIGGPPMLEIVTSFSNWADMAPPELSFRDHLVEKIGAEAADELLTDFAKGKVRSVYSVWYYAEEISSGYEEADE